MKSHFKYEDVLRRWRKSYGQTASIDDFAETEKTRQVLTDRAAQSIALVRRCLKCIVIRSLFVFMELVVILVFLSYHTIVSTESLTKDYLLPLIDLHRWTVDKKERDVSYYHRHCQPADQTAFDTSELLVDDDENVKDFVTNMNRHGVQIFPNLLREDTATELRNFVLEQNKKDDGMISVIEQQNRWSFYLKVDHHPTVAKALNELLTNERLVQSLEAITGFKDPAVLELTVLTSAYGAVGQYWHQDIEGTQKHARNFMAYYSLFIPLQNTTSAMGATAICPGSHICADTLIQFCETSGFQVSGRQDLWNVGSGALVNGGLLHRGTAHTDPNGPDRVLLIPTFGPRPVEASKQRIETRIAPLGGVYALHWTQYGHTISDYINASKYMQQPWRTLRSLGVYSRHSYRSWDIWTPLLTRLANNEVGFSPKLLLNSSSENSSSIPRLFLRDIIENSEKSSNERTKFRRFITQTLHRCRLLASVTQCVVLIFYILILIVLKLLSPKIPIKRSVIKLLAGKAVLALCTFYLLNSLRSSYWARIIRRGQMANLPKTLNQFPDLPGTLPLRSDILMMNHMQSEYLGSYTRIVDDTHPGNRVWYNDIVPYYSFGYANLSLPIQRSICHFILKLLGHEGRRLLTKNSRGGWAVATEGQRLRYCHRALMQDDNQFVRHAVRNIDFLLAETQYGYWRDTVLHRRILPERLSLLRDKIIHFDRLQHIIRKTQTRNIAPKQIVQVFSIVPMKPRSMTQSLHSDSLLYRHEENEPFPGAWLEEGDLVELPVKTDDSDDIYWYTATIDIANANEFNYDVSIENGDEQINRDLKYIRRFEPYDDGDEIEVDMTGEGDYEAARVVRMGKNSNMFIVMLLEDETTVKVHRSLIRKMYDLSVLSAWNYSDKL